MAKTRKKTSAPADATDDSADSPVSGKGKNLVIVESPAKAKTINKYLGSDYIVKASVGHIRDLPPRNPKGVKWPVPGVDLDNDFQPTYQIIEGKGKAVTDLKRTARTASNIWLATDLDREGEAIAWHLAEALGIDMGKAKRVVFNAITADEIRRAFSHPRQLDIDKVNAQQARRILDRIVGYQVSPLLWKKVAGGLSAGRVQSVAVRLVVEREREIQAFDPEEYWKIAGLFTTHLASAGKLAAEWARFLADAPRKEGEKAPAGRTIRERNAWLQEHAGIAAELIEVDGAKFEPKTFDQAIQAARAAGFSLESQLELPDPKGKGKAAHRLILIGRVGADGPRWNVRSIETKRSTSRSGPPFITSTLQQAAANVYGFSAQTTMRTAQQLYEGVEIKGMGSVGLITYMRTDSTHLSKEALAMARDYIGKQFGPAYLPDSPNFYRSSNKDAQEAHEAIRPTDVQLSPQQLKTSLEERQFKLYSLIWSRFLACQMNPAQWDSTAVLIDGKAAQATLTFKATGRTLVFDGFYRASGQPDASDELTLPPLAESQEVAALQIDPQQKFTSPPPRYTEASLVKKLEAEGIGRPSTYASIISVIQDRKYVEKIGGRFFATDLGMVVTDMLMTAFPQIMDVGYTRQMEEELDAIEEQHHDWVQMLRKFYSPFKKDLETAHDKIGHAKAETEPAPFKCPSCGAATVYRFGKNGRFLSCSRYPDCKYAAPIDREGQPQIPETTKVACPICSAAMLLRKGRFGPFLSCSNYPTCKGIVKIDRKGFVALPKAPPLATDMPCPKCASPLALRSGKRGPWLSCSKYPKCRGRAAWTKLHEDPKQNEKLQKHWQIALENHEKANPVAALRTIDGKTIGENYKPVTPSQAAAGETDAPTPDLDAA
jgi:DNA topoisomerase-1